MMREAVIIFTLGVIIPACVLAAEHVLRNRSLWLCFLLAIIQVLLPLFFWVLMALGRYPDEAWAVCAAMVPAMGVALSLANFRMGMSSHGFLGVIGLVWWGFVIDVAVLLHASRFMWNDVSNWFGRDYVAGVLIALVAVGNILVIWYARSVSRNAVDPTIQSEICQSCGYELQGNPDATHCPECGQVIAAFVKPSAV